MTDRLPKPVLIGGAILAVLVLAYAAFSRPWYFTNQTNLAGLVFLELLLVAIWLYRRVFFPVVIGSFVLAGVDLPVGAGWAAARWVVLGIGAFTGFFIVLRDRGYRFGFFHAVATFAVLTGLVSAAVSRYPSVAVLKALSLFLLFLYGATGARVAVSGRENSFFNGLVFGCEIFVALVGACYAVGIEAMGNPNSLGAVMGVVCAPILLWGILAGGEKRTVQWRRWTLYVVCMVLVFASHARAGLAAALLSCGVLCLGLRKYKMAIEGSIILLIVVAATAILSPDALPGLTSSVVYKGADIQLGVLASRESPWHAAMDNIRDHPWFGTGLGTTANGTDADPREQKTISSTTNVTTENGSSYLAIVSGVGVFGVLPFALLLILLIGMVLRTLHWMRKTGNAAHPAVPLAIVMVAGIAHAGFEDWMFAPGYYLCVFFWSLAFILADVVPGARVSAFAWKWTPKRLRQRSMGAVVPTR